MGHSLAAQQAGREREALSTGRPNMLPPIQTRNGHVPPGSDLRTAPIDRSAETSERPQFFRPSNGRYEVLPQSGRPMLTDRRSLTGHPGPPTGDRIGSFGNGQGQGRPAHSTTPPRTSTSVTRQDFLAPFDRLYDVLAQSENHKYTMQDLIHRYELALSTKHKEIGDFKSTAQAASTLLNNLQQSADSLKDMVRYEISRAPPPPGSTTSAGGHKGGLSSEERKEFEDMKIRMKKLEDILLSRENGDGERSSKRRKSNGSVHGSMDVEP